MVPKSGPLAGEEFEAPINGPAGYRVDRRNMELHARTRAVAAERGVSFSEALDIVKGGR